MAFLTIVLFLASGLGVCMGQSTLQSGDAGLCQRCSVDLYQKALDRALKMIQQDLASVLAPLSKEGHSNPGDENRGTCSPDKGGERPFYGVAVTSKSLGFDYLIAKENVTWLEARTSCFLRGYYLAHINSTSESFYLQHIIHTHPEIKKRNLIWIDGTDNGHEGCWVSTAERVTFLNSTFINWRGSEPNGKKNENCLAIYTTTSSVENWLDVRCGYTTYFICKRAIGQPADRMPDLMDFADPGLCSGQ